MNIQNYLVELKKTYEPTAILDIGANIGEFSIFCKNLWANVDIVMIEGNYHCQEYLHNTGFLYYLTLLGDTFKDVDFYIESNNLIGSGASYYKEITSHYNTPIIERRQVVPLDFFIDKKFDLIKIDTQGSELDIIKGGKNIISQAKYVILELSLKEYNKNAPNITDTISYMNLLGFNNMRIIDNHVWINHDNVFKYGEIFQIDAVFTKV